jgi:hypothetical protein
MPCAHSSVLIPHDHRTLAPQFLAESASGCILRPWERRRWQGLFPKFEIPQRTMIPAKTVRYNGLVTDSKPFRLTESVKAAG